MDQEKIGLLFKERREAKNITQQELADILNVTDRAISNWEHGRRLPDYSLLAKLCDTLSISLDEVFILGKKPEKDKTQAAKETNELIDYYLSTHSINKEDNGFKDEYCFDNFVIGECNGDAFCRCYEIANGLISINDDPLYIYGNKGTGKTHMVQWLGMYFRYNLDKKALYVTSLEFIDDCYNVSQGHIKIQSFMNKYRNLDVLIIDDIQLIKGDKTIIELFHLIDYLLEHKKLVIFTGDRSFEELNLDSQVKERIYEVFQLHLEPLDYETRKKVLAKLLKDFPKIKVFSSVATYIAKNTLLEDARILKDCANQLLVYALITGVKEIRLKQAKEALEGLVKDPDNEEIVGVESSFERGEELIEFLEKADNSFEYYTDKYHKELYRKDKKTSEWYELVIIMNAEVIYDEKDLTKNWVRVFKVTTKDLIKLDNYNEVIKIANTNAKDTISNPSKED